MGKAIFFCQIFFCILSLLFSLSYASLQEYVIDRGWSLSNVSFCPSLFVTCCCFYSLKLISSFGGLSSYNIDIHQLNLIIELLGTPSDEFMKKISSESVSSVDLHDVRGVRGGCHRACCQIPVSIQRRNEMHAAIVLMLIA